MPRSSSNRSGGAIGVCLPVRNEAGAGTGFAVHGIDQTDRIRAGFLVRDNDQRLELLLGNATDCDVGTTDPGGRVLDRLGGAEASPGSRRPTSSGT
ncbi:hypothetical protein [Fimbriiglobus ruber]|uniref:hypothetical protein n=1 Tax=Fimbriiglobus ruber TaxID=1908690 RepID=UPI00117A7949|nr:hypothetical protein [Fimbriiglobus ruber]